jgi:hypothetical protein|nr:MAG TPA: hypothetical protein [Caudoviricetes sp.]
MGSVKIEFHYDGFNELRKSYQSEIDALGEGFAASACAMADMSEGDSVRGGQIDASEEPFAYESKPNATRARGIVKTSTFKGRWAQAKDDVLTRAVLGG